MQLRALFVMGPHPKDFHHLFLLEHLVDKPMMDIDPSRVGSSEIPDQFLIGRWVLEWIRRHRGEERFSFASEPTSG